MQFKIIAVERIIQPTSGLCFIKETWRELFTTCFDVWA
jgi:hypothetical protein